MFFHHVTYLLYTCIHIHPRAHTRQYIGVVCVHISTQTWCNSTSWEESKMPDSDPSSAIKLLCELGPIIGYWLQFLHLIWLSPAPEQSFHFFKALPINYTIFSLHSPRRAAIMTPNLPSGSLRPSNVKRLAQGCIASEESRPGAWFPYSELKAFSPRFSCLSNETTDPSPSWPLRDPVRGQDALSIMGCKTH